MLFASMKGEKKKGIYSYKINKYCKALDTN